MLSTTGCNPPLASSRPPKPRRLLPNAHGTTGLMVEALWQPRIVLTFAQVGLTAGTARSWAGRPWRGGRYRQFGANARERGPHAIGGVARPG